MKLEDMVHSFMNSGPHSPLLSFGGMVLLLLLVCLVPPRKRSSVFTKLCTISPGLYPRYFIHPIVCTLKAKKTFFIISIMPSIPNKAAQMVCLTGHEHVIRGICPSKVFYSGEPKSMACFPF